MAPIDSYVAVTLVGRYRYDVYPAEVRPAGTTFLIGDVVDTVPLATLRPTVVRACVRGSLFGFGSG